MRIGDFGQHVEDTFYFLKAEFPGDFDHIAIRIRDLPSPRLKSESVKWAWSASHNLLTFYRVPMTYSGRRRDPVDEYLRVDWEIIKALASVTGKDPKNIWDGPGN